MWALIYMFEKKTVTPNGKRGVYKAMNYITAIKKHLGQFIISIAGIEIIYHVYPYLGITPEKKLISPHELIWHIVAIITIVPMLDFIGEKIWGPIERFYEKRCIKEEQEEW